MNNDRLNEFEDIQELIRFQNQQVLHHFKSGKTLTQDEARELYGIERLSARIAELRKKGHDIETETVYCVNRWGKKTHYGVYVYKGEIHNILTLDNKVTK